MDILINQREKRVFVNGVLIESFQKGIGIEFNIRSVNIYIVSFPRENRYSLHIKDEVLEEALRVGIWGNNYIEYVLNRVSYVTSKNGDSICGSEDLKLKDGCAYGKNRYQQYAHNLILKHKSQRGHVWYAD